MSNIVILINEKKLEASVLKKFHKLLGGSLAQIRAAITNNNPILELELFDNNYDEKATLLKSIINLIKHASLSVSIYEIPSEVSYEACSNLEESLIRIEVLENIIESSDEEMDRQLNM